MNLDKLAARLADKARFTRDALRASRKRSLDRPRRVTDVELIGRYQDSGFKDPPYIVRRPDGQVVQLTRLLYLLAAEADGTRDLEQLATTVSRRYGRTVSADNVALLIDSKLRPAGLICSQAGTSAPVRRTDPLLALRYRAAVVPPSAVRVAARALRPLFIPLVVGAAFSGLLALDVWLAQHGIGTAMRQLIAHPVLLLGLLGLVIVSAVWHELGHATACTYGGATPGPMGVGLYVIWPAFYTDVTDAYRLRRAARLRTDLGGVYFNALFALAAGGAYFATHYELLLAVVAVQHFQIIQQLTPLMRLDGYYVVTDLVGVPDILSRLKPLLLSFLPFRAPDRRVSELKPWVRAATSTYILLFITALAALLVLLGLNVPRLLPAAVHSAELYSHRAATAWHRHAFPAAALAEIQVLTVMLPALGLALGVIRLLRRLEERARSSVDRRLRLAVGIALAAGIGFAWPFLLRGLRPELHIRTAQASIRQNAHHSGSRSRRQPHAHHHRHRPSAASTGLTATAPPASQPTTGTAASYNKATAPATTTQPHPSAPASNGTPPTGPSTSGASTASGTSTATPPSQASTTTGSSTPSPSTTANTSSPSTSTPTTQTTPGSASTSTTPTTSTTTN